jgi:hypothetical protein
MSGCTLHKSLKVLSSSLLVEPRQAADAPPSGDLRQLFPWGSRSHAHGSQPVQVS